MFVIIFENLRCLNTFYILEHLLKVEYLMNPRICVFPLTAKVDSYLKAECLSEHGLRIDII